MNKFLKILKIFLITIFSILVLFISACIAIVYFYEDAIKILAIRELNKQLTTEITVKNVELSVLKTFPFASIVFEDVTAKDATKQINKGDLLKAKKIFLLFNVYDIFYGKYKIKKVIINDGLINLNVYEDDSDNYHFWKTAPDTVKTSFSFQLQKVMFNNVDFKYTNEEVNYNFSFNAKRATLKGNFSESEYTLNTNADLYINYFKIEDIDFFHKGDLELYLLMNVKNYIMYKILDSDVKFSEQKFDVSGNFTHSPQIKNINLTIKGKDLEAEKVLNRLPKEYKKYLREYESKGDLYFVAILNGSYKGKNIPLLKVDFGIKNGEIIEKKSSITLRKLSCSGFFTNGQLRKPESYFLNIKNFTASMNGGNINADYEIKNFVNPSIKLTMQASFDFKDLHDFIKIDTLEDLKGTIRLNASFLGKFENFENISAKDFINSNASGNIYLNNVSFRIKKNPLKFTDIDASLVFRNNDLAVDNLNGKVSNTDIKMNGIFRNAIAYMMLDDQRLMVEASLFSSKINFDEILQDRSSGSNNSYVLAFPNNIDFNINAEIESIKFRRFEANNIKGKVKINEKELTANALSLNTMNGNINADLTIDASQKKEILITCNADIKKVDVNKMFYEFENFGQNKMKAENIRGIMTAKVQFASLLNHNLEINPDKIYAKSDITIEKGELINYEPLKDLSKFIKLKDVEHITFSTLKNQVEIKNRIINIPAMEIKSSELTLQLKGTHSFSNEINYHIKLQLSEILANKAKKSKKENEEFGVVEQDNTGKTNLFISVTGTIDNPKYTYDTKGVKENIVTNIKKEKQTLKEIIKDEFKWIKKDTSKSPKTPENYDVRKKQKPKKSKEDEENDFKIKLE
ncbi:MAG: AsmA-like C-terminal region-containing protein [Bacteroidales bacterium]|nr:AsmA-like C-terminal region-containing protein [Bacteroidales bacterium]